jgi:hypothetical protein
MIAPARGRELWVPTSLLALSVAFVGWRCGFGIELLSQWAHREHLFVRSPVGEVRITQSTNGSVVGAWRVQRGFAGAGLQVGPAPGGRRGEDGALRVTVNSRQQRPPFYVQFFLGFLLFSAYWFLPILTSFLIFVAIGLAHVDSESLPPSFIIQMLLLYFTTAYLAMFFAFETGAR